MLKKQYSVDQIADTFEREFHLPRAELLSDISEFLTELEAKHLIHHGSHQAAKPGWLAKILHGERNGHPSTSTMYFTDSLEATPVLDLPLGPEETRSE